MSSSNGLGQSPRLRPRRACFVSCQRAQSRKEPASGRARNQPGATDGLPIRRLAGIVGAGLIMPDEIPIRSGEQGDSRDGSGGSAGEPASLQGRAALVANWDWQSVVRINERLCSGGRAQFGKNSETHADCEREWTAGRTAERTVFATLDWLRSFHRKAPFLFFNGNTFAEIGRTLVDITIELSPSQCRRALRS